MLTAEEETFRTYNLKDCYATHYSILNLQDEIERAGLTKFYNELVMPLAHLVVKLNLTGIYVDHKKRTDAIAKLSEDTKELQNAMNDLAGREMNVDSDDFRQFLYHELGLKCPSYTKKTHTEQIGEDTLHKLAQQYPDIAPVTTMALEIRAKKKMVSTFLPQGWVADDGRVYPSYRIGPATGRLSCKKPNFQNIPEGIAREVFCASPGHVFVYADYSQVELRILAVLANDQPFLEAFARGEDIHDYNARDLFGIAPDQKPTGRQRYFAKTFQFGINYGGTVETIRGRGSEVFHDIPIEVMRNAADRYFQKHPNVMAFREGIKDKIYKERILIGAFGRPRIFFDDPKEAIRQGYNYPMQNGAADLLNKKMIMLDKWLVNGKIPSRLVLQVHDCVMYETKIGYEELVAKKVKEVLEEPVPEFNSYSFPAKVKVGDSWGNF